MAKKLADLLTDDALKTDTESAPETDNVKDEAEKEEKLFKPYDPKTHSEFLELERFKIEQENEKLERELRKDNAIKAFNFSAYWGGFIGILILFHGFGKRFKFFDLTQTEFLFIIGTLTTSIFAFYTLVLKYLFYRKPDPKTQIKK
ncbi:hypothetical protein [Flavobacterium mesophilum]|uniref:hypothetical protein n=1 Tax=Flavobacterium mesophilum TaxID=3143495 RepID=UPI0031DCF100